MHELKTLRGYELTGWVTWGSDSGGTAGRGGWLCLAGGTARLLIVFFCVFIRIAGGLIRPGLAEFSTHLLLLLFGTPYE